MYIVTHKTQIFIPGDERSRSAPGHGYPARYQDVDVVLKFDTKGQVIDWLKGNSSKSGIEVYDAEKQKVSFYNTVTIE